MAPLLLLSDELAIRRGSKSDCFESRVYICSLVFLQHSRQSAARIVKARGTTGRSHGNYQRCIYDEVASYTVYSGRLVH